MTAGRMDMNKASAMVKAKLSGKTPSFERGRSHPFDPAKAGT